jgi:Domain of unknown function (DUF4340)
VSAKHLKLIALGLAVLLLLWGGSALFSRGSDTVTGSLTLPALRAADVDSIILGTGPEALRIAKQSATAWTVNGARAAPASVDELFQALADRVRPELVAQDASSFARLQVDSATGRALRLVRGGKPVLELIVGMRANEFQTVYLRRPGDAHVYLWRGALASVVRRAADDWRDKRIAVLDPDSIGALDVQRGPERYTVRRVGKAWVLDGAGTDSAAVAQYLGRVRTITAAGFASAAEVDSTRARRPSRRLTVRGRPGVLLTLAFDSTPGGFVVRHVAGVGGEGTTVYRMNLWDVDGLTPARRALVRPVPR